jgi:hypothetical protein
MKCGLGMAILSACLAAALPAGAQTPSPAGNRVIAGVVVSARSGQPLDNAIVTLSGEKTRKEVAATTSDAQGRFSFANLPDGRFSLRASRRGFMTAAFDQHGGVSTAIVTGDGLETTGLRFTLEPQAAIFGTVTEDSGDPVPQAHISLFRTDQTTGTGRIVRAGSTSADTLGHYEIAHLEPGNYFLCVSGTPWYARRGQTARVPEEGAGGGQALSTLDVAYPTTCYPGVTDPGAAEPITAGAGERIPTDVIMHAVPAAHISIRVPSPEDRAGALIPQLRENLFGSQEFVPGSSSYVTQGDSGSDSQRTVEIEGVAPGQYEFQFPSRGDGPTRYASVDATGDGATIDTSSLAQAAMITGKVTMADGAGLPSGTVLFLRPKQGGDGARARVDDDGGFRIPTVRPGEYEVVVSAGRYAMQVERLKANGAAMRVHLLKVSGEAIELNAVVAPAEASVNGSVIAGGKPASGVFIVLVPADASATRDEWRQNQSDSDGSFSFPQVLPGDYTAVAIDEGWTLEWGQPDVMSKYLAKGEKVSVTPGSKAVDLKEPLVAQPK